MIIFLNDVTVNLTKNYIESLIKIKNNYKNQNT